MTNWGYSTFGWIHDEQDWQIWNCYSSKPPTYISNLLALIQIKGHGLRLIKTIWCSRNICGQWQCALLWTEWLATVSYHFNYADFCPEHINADENCELRHRYSWTAWLFAAIWTEGFLSLKRLDLRIVFRMQLCLLEWPRTLLLIHIDSDQDMDK